MNRISITFALLVGLLLAATPAAARPLVAVLDFSEARTGMHAEELSVLGDIARGEALRVLGHDYDVITRESLVDLLKSHGKTLEKCSGECETETGRLLGAELVVSGRIVKAFGKYKVNLKVHRTDPPALLGAEMMSADEAQGLESAVREGTRKVLSTVPGARASASSSPSPARSTRRSRPTTGSVAKNVVKGVVRAAGKSAERSLDASARSAEAASQAVSDLADKARALRAEAASLSKSWAELEALATNEDLSKDQRIAAVKLFLARAPKESGYHRKASALLDELTEGPAWYGTKTEWFSIGYLYAGAFEGGSGGFLGFPVYKWDKLYWQTLEYGAAFVEGTYAGDPDVDDYGDNYVQWLSSIVGYRVALSHDGRQDLRIGAGLAWLGMEDDAQMSYSAAGSGNYTESFVGAALIPEVGWIVHMGPGVSVQSKLRLIVPVGEGYQEGYCSGGDCPWSETDDYDWTPDTTFAFSLGVGW